MVSEEKEVEVVSSVDLEIGTIFQKKNDNSGLQYIYIGCYDFYSFVETDNTIFTTYTQVCETMVHVFYCKQRNEFTSFKWAQADKIEEKLNEQEIDNLIRVYRTYPVGVKVREAEFHVNHLNFNPTNIPLNITSNKSVLFCRSAFKEINHKDKFYLVFEWDENTKAPNYSKFKPHIIKIIDSKPFAFDYIPQAYWDKYKDFFNMEDVQKYIKQVQDVATQSPGLLCSFSESLKEKFLWEKSKSLQTLKLGTLYLINEKV